MDGNMGREPGWQEPRHGAGPPSGPIVPTGYPPAILVGFGVIAVLLVAIGVVLVTGDDSGGGEDDSELTASSGEEDDTSSADEEGGAPEAADEPAQDQTPEAEVDEEPGGDEGEGDAPSGGIDPADLPPPDIPENADPPPMAESLEGMTFPYDPFNGVDWPTIGGTVVEVTPGEYVDLAVHLEPGELVVSFPGNDGIFATVEVYGPDGEILQVADDLGEPGLVQWMEFTDYSGDTLQEAGTYVFRVIQHDGLEDGMAIGFFTPPE